MNPLLIEILSLFLGLVTDGQTHKSNNHLSGEYKMSIQKFTFGQFNAAATTAKTDKPKAQFWLNIGYVANEGSDDEKFISLPTGIPLDTQEPLPTNSSNADFRAMRCAQNDLLEQLIAYAQNLEPGEEGIINLQVQLRRVKAEAADIPADENKYARKLTF
ncbi:RNA polymerase subunit A [Escherichia phage HK2]